MNGEELEGRYAAALWSWDWLGAPIGMHPKIRPADIDGYLHQNGELLFLEGKATAMIPQLTQPQRMAVQRTQNLTILLVHCDPANFHDHRPTRLRGYQVFPSHTFPWEGGCTYQPLNGGMPDEDTLRTVLNVIVGWCWWAGTRQVAS